MIAVIADDLSGAAELAGVARRRGLQAEVHTRAGLQSDADVICIDTDTRSRPSAEAALLVRDVAQQVVAARPEWIYKKCDSVLRGNVIAEILAVQEATGKSRAVLASANPSRGRVIRDGHFFIDEKPLHTTELARDPEHPRTTAYVRDLLLSPRNGNSSTGGAVETICIPDVASETDLIRVSNTIGEDTLPAGGADFFEALLSVAGRQHSTATPERAAARAAAIATAGMELTGPTLLVCGSAAVWDTRLQQAAEHHIAAFAMPHELAELERAWNSQDCILLGIGNGPFTRELGSKALLNDLARTVGALFRARAAGRMCLEGGATAAAVVRELGWQRLTALEAFLSGVGVLRPGGASGPVLWVKPGSYDWPGELWRD
jgi:D-threonate/D-erythronate kinase